MGSTTRPLGVTHQFELHFVVTLLEGEDKEYEHRHVQHEGYESVVAVQEQEEVLGGGGGGRGRSGTDGQVGRGRGDKLMAWHDATALLSITHTHTKCIPN